MASFLQEENDKLRVQLQEENDKLRALLQDFQAKDAARREDSAQRSINVQPLGVEPRPGTLHNLSHIKMPTFDGNPENYIMFRKRFLVYLLQNGVRSAVEPTENPSKIGD